MLREIDVNYVTATKDALKVFGDEWIPTPLELIISKQKRSIENDSKRTRIADPEEVMQRLNVGRNTVYALLNTGAIKGFRMGNRWKIPSWEELRSSLINTALIEHDKASSKWRT